MGAYKYPREITWMSGVILMICTLGLAFSGQVLRWDEDAYWGLGIGAAILGRVPLIGEGLVNVMLGGPIMASETLSRFLFTACLHPSGNCPGAAGHTPADGADQGDQ